MGARQGYELVPPRFALGAPGGAVDIGPVTVAADLLVEGREAPFAQGYAYGFEARLSRILFRYGERHFPEGFCAIRITVSDTVLAVAGLTSRWGRFAWIVAE